MTSTEQISGTRGKAQHYIPRVYLKRLVDSAGRLWVLEHGKKPRPSIPKDEAHRKDFYTFQVGEERDETAERILSTLESRVSPVLKGISNPQFQMSPEQTGSLYLFVALMFVRVPAWREFLDKAAVETMKNLNLKLAQDPDHFYASFVESQKHFGKGVDPDRSKAEAEKLRSFILSGEYELEQKSVGFNLGMMFQSLFDLAEELTGFGFHILLPPQPRGRQLHDYGPPESRAFITSDNPVFTVRPGNDGTAGVGVGFGWPGTEVYMPISKRCCLRLSKGLKPAHAYTTEKFVAQINRMVMANASKFVYSSIGEKRLGRLFDEFGCEIKARVNAFLPK